MEQYKVIYEIDVTASNPKEAAKEVSGYITDGQSLPPILKVTGKDGKEVIIDTAKEQR